MGLLIRFDEHKNKHNYEKSIDTNYHGISHSFYK